MTVQPENMPATPRPATALHVCAHVSGRMQGMGKGEGSPDDLPTDYQDAARGSSRADQRPQLEEEDGSQKAPLGLYRLTRVSLFSRRGNNASAE